MQAEFDADEFEDTLDGLLAEADSDTRADAQRKLLAYRNHNQLLGMSDGMAPMSFALRAALEGDRAETAQHFAHAQLLFADADGPRYYPQLDQPTDDIYALLGDAAPDATATGETERDDPSASEAESADAEEPGRGHRAGEPPPGEPSPVDRARRAVLELKGRRALEDQYAQSRSRDEDDANRRANEAAAVGGDERSHVLTVYDD